MLKTIKDIDPKKIPHHIAIIMDGNGRWAKARGLSRINGHRAGADSIRSVVRTCGEIGVKYLTLYAFSVENWKRPKSEVNALMHLLKVFLRKEVAELNDNNVRLLSIGRTHELPSEAQAELKRAKERLDKNTGLHLILALNYGGRAEISDAVKGIAKDCSEGKLAAGSVDEDLISSRLYTGKIGALDPDLLIRTSGEMRVSNFLLWQISYTEIYVTETLWPDFREKDLFAAIKEFQKRERRFGGI